MKRTRIYDGLFDLVLPDHLAEWDVWTYWERERFDSMTHHLRSGDSLFIMGAEHGALAAVWAQIVGPEAPVLFEPSPEFWPNIRKTWEANYVGVPQACVQSLVGAKVGEYEPSIQQGEWPHWADSDEEAVAQSYRYLHNPKDVETTPTITVDDFIARTTIMPRALSIDVEGAELQVLRGMTDTLIDHSPLLWVSIHPDLMKRDYSPDMPAELHYFLESFGYKAERLHVDHEEHWLFRRRP
jgi:FkbM family methyltransferase